MSNKTDTALPAEAQQAWQAYLAMSESKQGYFGFLQALDQKYSKQDSPSLAENLKLEDLLDTHDKRVKAFNQAMAAIDKVEAREALLRKLSAEATNPGSP